MNSELLLLIFNQVHGKRERQISPTFLLIQYTQQRHTQISSSYNKRRYLHITALKAEADEKVQFLQFAIVMHEAVYLTYVLFQSYSAFQSWRS